LETDWRQKKSISEWLQFIAFHSAGVLQNGPAM
jgi:hypothetical protein